MTRAFPCRHCGHLIPEPSGEGDTLLSCPECGRPFDQPRRGPEDPRPQHEEDGVVGVRKGRSAWRAVAFGMLALACAAFAVLFFAGALGEVAGLLGVGTPAVRRAVRDGMARQAGVPFRRVDLQPRPDGGWRGTALDEQGREWDLPRVWREGNMVRWAYLPPREVFEQQFRAQIEARLGDRVVSLRMGKGADGRYAGRAQTLSGIACDVGERSRPDGTPFVYWKMNPGSYPAWLKRQVARQQKIELAEVKLDRRGEKEWRGEGADAAGRRYELVLRAVAELPAEEGGEQLSWTIREKR